MCVCVCVCAPAYRNACVLKSCHICVLVRIGNGTKNDYLDKGGDTTQLNFSSGSFSVNACAATAPYLAPMIGAAQIFQQLI